MLNLVLMSGPQRGQNCELPKSGMHLIGRAHCSLSLPDPTVSWVHAEISFADGRWCIYDLSSTNGTYVNGGRISQATAIYNGDQIRLGQTVLAVDCTQKNGQGIGRVTAACIPVRRPKVGPLAAVEPARRSALQDRLNESPSKATQTPSNPQGEVTTTTTTVAKSWMANLRLGWLLLALTTLTTLGLGVDIFLYPH